MTIYLKYTGHSELERLSTSCLYGLGFLGYAAALYPMPRLQDLPKGWRLAAAIALDIVMPSLIVLALFVSHLLCIPGL